jgi:outer membrane protein assembly factor BamB
MSLPTVADDVVYAAQRHRMWAVNAVTGRPLWNVKVYDHRTYLNPPPTMAGGVLYAAEGGHVLALDIATGDRRWDVCPHGKGVVAMDAATGGERWRLATGDTLHRVEGGVGECAGPACLVPKFRPITQRSRFS